MSISSRIEQIEQHIGNAYDGLEDLGIDLTNVDKNINNISSMLENVWNEYPKVTATDIEEATLNGTKKGRMNIDLKGNTKQDTTTGANLMKFNKRTGGVYGTTYKCDEKGQVTIIGTSTEEVGYGYNLVTNPVSLLAGTYKIKVIGDRTGVSFLRNNYAITLDSNQEAIITLENDVDNLQIMQHINAGTYNCNYYITLASGTTATTERYTRRNTKPKPRLPTTN